MTAQHTPTPSHALLVLRESLADIRDTAADLVAASAQPEVNLYDVTRAMQELHYAVVHCNVLWQTWHEHAIEPTESAPRPAVTPADGTAAPCTRRAPWDAPLLAEDPHLYGRLCVILEGYAHTPAQERPTWRDMARKLNQQFGTRFSRQSLKKYVNRTILGRPAGPRPRETTFQEAATWLNSHFGATVSVGSLKRYLARWRRIAAKDAALTA